MASQDIAAAVARAEQLLIRRPSAALQADKPASARWIGGMKVAASAGEGVAVVTDVPAALGGEGEGVTPGWLARAALATCAVSCVVMAAARAGVELARVEADVRSRSDVRGILGLAGDQGPVNPGLGDVELMVRVAARGATPERLQALVADAERLSPMSALFEHPTPVRLSIETEP